MFFGLLCGGHPRRIVQEGPVVFPRGDESIGADTLDTDVIVFLILVVPEGYQEEVFHYGIESVLGAQLEGLPDLHR